MAVEATRKHVGGGFLINPAGSDTVFSPEAFTDEQRMMAQTADRFMTGEVDPLAEEIDSQQPGLMRSLVEKAGDLGLLATDIPEEYEGLGLGLTVSTILADYLAGEASFGVAWGAHTTIGSMPIIFFGTDAQKQQWLPGLASGKIVAAYALTEPGAGSDAMGLKTSAVLDGDAYVINGQKQWISNAGFADMFSAFAKVDGKITAFIVPAGAPGISLGAEEKKMGIKGSSTRTVYFDNVRVPVSDVLGEIGKGHKIAFNILNIGRLKLGASTTGGSRRVIGLAAKYVTERRAFNKTLSQFGLIQKKIGVMAVETYASEAATYRTAGLIEEKLETTDRSPAEALGAIEEYALECSIVKVLGSETLARVVDQGVQIFGGYGFMHEYPVEKAYRDARITRIFEGTNEINRMLASGTLVKRALTGRVGIMDAAKAADEAIAANSVPALDVPAELHEAAEILERAKAAAVSVLVKASTQYLNSIESEQEFLSDAADIMIDLFAMDSAVERASSALRTGASNAHVHTLCARLAVWNYLPGVQRALEEILENLAVDSSTSERDAEQAKIRSYIGAYHLASTPALRELAGIVIERGGYPLAAVN